MKTLTQARQTHLIQYFKIKNQLDIPLKLKVYFSILQNLTNKSKAQNIPKESARIFHLLLKTFQKQTLQQKGHFLKQNICFLKQYLKNPSLTGKQSLEQISIQSIETQCNLMSKRMGVSYWAKAHFKFSKDKSKITITIKDKQYGIDLRVYYSRKSHKLKNTIKFQATSQEIKQRYRCYVVQFRDAAIFNEVYQHTRMCVIKFSSQQLVHMLNEKNQNIVLHLDKIDKGLQILNSKAISGYFDFKDQFIKLLQKESKKFKIVSQSQQGMISILKVKSEKHPIYKLERVYNLDMKKIQAKLPMFVRNYPNGNLRHYQTVETFSKTIQAGYYRYWILNHQYEFLSIIEDNCNQNQRVVFIKGVDNLMVKKTIDFIMIKAQKIDGDEPMTKISAFGYVQIKGIEANLANSFFLKDLTDIQGKVTKIISAENNEGFVSVRGQFQFQQHQLKFFESSNFGKAKFDQIYDDKTLCLDQNGNIIEIKNQFDGQEAQNMVSAIFRKQCIQEVEDEDIKRSSINTQKTTQDDQKIKQHYIRYKCLMEPQSVQKSRDLLDSYYLTDQQWYRGKSGGLVWANKNMIEQQKKVVKRILSQMGDNIMKCKSIMNISFPVQIFRKESHLKTIARFFSYAPQLIQGSDKLEPLQRMKKVIPFAISEQVMGICMDKPFNPFLGQTYQGHVDGCPIFLQQISHHPPVSYYNFHGRGYKMHGSVDPRAQMGLNSVKGHSQTPQFIHYNDGLVIEHRGCPLLLKGIMFGNRQFHFEGKGYLFDQKHHIFTEILMGPKNTSILSYKSQPLDIVTGSIYKVKPGFIHQFKETGRKNYPKKSDIEQTYGTIKGIWSQRIKYTSLIDKQELQMINFNKDFPCKLVDDSNSLPSDGNHRPDLQYFIKNDINAAQQEKTKLEQQQRKQKKLRDKKNRI